MTSCSVVLWPGDSELDVTAKSCWSEGWRNVLVVDPWSMFSYWLAPGRPLVPAHGEVAGLQSAHWFVEPSLGCATDPATSICSSTLPELCTVYCAVLQVALGNPSALAVEVPPLQLP